MLVLLLAFAAGWAAAAPLPGTWVELPNAASSPARYGGAAAFDPFTRTAYVWGGIDSSGPTDTLNAFGPLSLDPSDASTTTTYWIATVSTPAARAYAGAAFCHATKTFVMAGGQRGAALVADVDAISLADTPPRAWKVATPLPSIRSGVKGECDAGGTHAVLFGGGTAARFNDLFVIDTTNRSYVTTLAQNTGDTAPFVAGPTLVLKENSDFLVFGGRFTGATSFSRSVYTVSVDFSQPTAAWTRLANSGSLTARSDAFGTYFAVQQKLIIGYGYSQTASGSIFPADVWEFSLASSTWTEATISNPAMLPAANYRMASSVAVSNRSAGVFVFGGIVNPGSVYRDSAWILSFNSAAGTTGAATGVSTGVSTGVVTGVVTTGISTTGANVVVSTTRSTTGSSTPPATGPSTESPSSRLLPFVTVVLALAATAAAL
jgi:hypothetical protein